MPPPDQSRDANLPKPAQVGQGPNPERNPYTAFVRSFEELMDSARSLPLGEITLAKPVPTRAGAPVVMVFAPHPDDECIVGALPLRLRRALGERVLAVAVTQGSRLDRQDARLEEMRQACAFLGFELQAPCKGGLAGLHPDRRELAGMSWDAAVGCILQVLVRHRPTRIFLPHGEDQNTTHQGTHRLVMDALHRMDPGFRCQVFETEFWSPMVDPNVMVESTAGEVADLVAATSFHRGEVQRNPYHLRLPSWMSDNVRRGGELLGGQGGTAPDYHFATLYRLSFWEGGGLLRCGDLAMLAAGAGLGSWFAEKASAR